MKRLLFLATIFYVAASDAHVTLYGYLGVLQQRDPQSYSVLTEQIATVRDAADYVYYDGYSVRAHMPDGTELILKET